MDTSAQDSDLAPFLEIATKMKKNSEIKPPLKSITLQKMGKNTYLKAFESM